MVDYEKSFFNGVRSKCERIDHIKIPRGNRGAYALGSMFVPIDKLGPWVLVAHATGNDHLFPMLGLIKGLIDDGFSVVSFDLDGHGRNSTSLLADADPLSMIESVVDQIYQEIGNENLFFYGQSLGAALGIECASRIEGLFARFVAVAPPITLKSPLQFLVNEAKTFFRKDFQTEKKIYNGFGLLPAVGPYRRSTYPVRLPEDLLSRGYLAVVGNMIRQMNLTDQFAQIRCPSHALVGTKDMLTDIRIITEITSNLKNWDLTTFDGKSHFEMLFSRGVHHKVREWLRLPC